MKNCLLCANSGKHCVCEHCENYDSFIISNEGKLIINQIKKETTKEICDEIIRKLETDWIDAVKAVKETAKSKGVEVK